MRHLSIRILFITAVVLFYTVGVSQNSLVLRINAHFTPTNQVTPEYIGDDPAFRGISPSIGWIIGKNEHEIGAHFFHRKTGEETDPAYIREWETSLSYDLRLDKSPEKDLVFLLGYGTRGFYYRGDYHVTTTTDYPRQHRRTGLSFCAKPVLRYRVSSRLFAEVGLEVINLSGSYYRIHMDNPTLLERQRTAAGIDFDLDIPGRIFVSAGFSL